MQIAAYLCIDCIVFMIRWCWFLFCISSKSATSGLSWFSTLVSVSALFSSDSKWSFIAAFVPKLKTHLLYKLTTWCHTCNPPQQKRTTTTTIISYNWTLHSYNNKRIQTVFCPMHSTSRNTSICFHINFDLRLKTESHKMCAKKKTYFRCVNNRNWATKKNNNNNKNW